MHRWLVTVVVVSLSSCRLGLKTALNMEKNGCLNHASSNHFIARKTAKVPPLFRLESCPPWLQFNKYILAGYRCHLSTRQCMDSLFYIHNETFNIYSHGKYESKKNSLCQRSLILRLQVRKILGRNYKKNVHVCCT